MASAAAGVSIALCVVVRSRSSLAALDPCGGAGRANRDEVAGEVEEQRARSLEAYAQREKLDKTSRYASESLPRYFHSLP